MDEKSLEPYIWPVLDKIEKKSRRTPKGDLILFFYYVGRPDESDFDGYGMNVLYLLKQWGAIKIHNKEIFDDEIRFYILLATNFKPIYEEFTKKQTALQTNPIITQKVTKKGVKMTINQIIKIVKGNKMRKLLEVLSDLKPHKRSELISKTSYSASLNSLSHLKAGLDKVLRRNGFYISTEPPAGFIDPTGFYQIKSSPSLYNEATFQV